MIQLSLCLTFFDFQPKTCSFSIIGIGGGAGRIVEKMQKCELPDTDLYVFGMNKKEMRELSLAHKYLIGTDGLGSGKDRVWQRQNVRNRCSV